MPARPRQRECNQHEAADSGYFAPLGPARHMRLTTFKPNGIPASASVHGVADGGRVYFRVRSQSGTAKRLQHVGAVQVTPCGVLALCTYGPPLDMIARPLPGEQASRVATWLDRQYPVRFRFLARLLRRPTMYYELVAEDAAGDQDELPGGFSASLITGVHLSQGLIDADAVTPPSLATLWASSPMSRRGPADRIQITTVSMSLRNPAELAPVTGITESRRTG